MPSHRHICKKNTDAHIIKINKSQKKEDSIVRYSLPLDMRQHRTTTIQVLPDILELAGNIGGHGIGKSLGDCLTQTTNLQKKKLLLKSQEFSPIVSSDIVHFAFIYYVITIDILLYFIY